MIKILIIFVLFAGINYDKDRNAYKYEYVVTCGIPVFLKKHTCEEAANKPGSQLSRGCCSKIKTYL